MARMLHFEGRHYQKLVNESFLLDSSRNTYCMSIMLPEMPDGARLSWLLHPALRFFMPKKRVRLGDADPKLCMSENEAWE